MTVHYLGSW